MTKSIAQSTASSALYNLCPYDDGHTSKSVTVIVNHQHICETHLAGEYNIEVIDLTKIPQLGAGNEIITIPPLVCRMPQPIKKIIGYLSKEGRMLVGLDLSPVNRSKS